jgi:hypothetical protein
MKKVGRRSPVIPQVAVGRDCCHVLGRRHCQQFMRRCSSAHGSCHRLQALRVLHRHDRDSGALHKATDRFSLLRDPTAIHQFRHFQWDPWFPAIRRSFASKGSGGATVVAGGRPTRPPLPVLCIAFVHSDWDSPHPAGRPAFA